MPATPDEMGPRNGEGFRKSSNNDTQHSESESSRGLLQEAGPQNLTIKHQSTENLLTECGPRSFSADRRN
ncbi:uncharacterized protein CCR75_003379 [Bremia lactucae]|uniref:Uncharacterized protein n=1 Tax=Bremia lactucae TaxID=4779 RepID=A0A976IHL4_BRELC|nr:hypothetical protein CCR75_003379 [Bremia lactucae]